MQLTVLVERIDEQTYRAETAQPVSMTPRAARATKPLHGCSSLLNNVWQ